MLPISFRKSKFTGLTNQALSNLAPPPLPYLCLGSPFLLTCPPLLVWPPAPSTCYTSPPQDTPHLMPAPGHSTLNWRGAPFPQGLPCRAVPGFQESALGSGDKNSLCAFPLHTKPSLQSRLWAHQRQGLLSCLCITADPDEGFKHIRGTYFFSLKGRLR